MDDEALIRRIQQQIKKGMNSEDGDVTHVRQKMFSYYYGEPFGNERDGYSKYVEPVVADAVEWALPAIMRVLLGPKNVAEFAATGGDDVKQAKQETDVVNYWIYNGSSEDGGFLPLYAWAKDLCLYPNGYAKVWMTEKEEVQITRHRGVSDAVWHQLQEAIRQQNISADVSAEERPDGLYDLEVSDTKMVRSIEIECLPPDEVIIQHGWTKLNLDNCPFICHRVRKSRSDLIAEGFDPDDLEDVSPAFDTSDVWNSEEVTRLFYADETPGWNDDDEYADDDESSEMLMVHECYMLVDWDDDGIAERRKITMVGCKILENEQDDFVPIIAATAMHVTHKHVGRSLAESVATLQELASTLWRQGLDNIYRQNVRRKYVAEGALLTDNSTMDALLDGSSEVVPVRGSPVEAIMPEQVQPIVGDILQVIQAIENKPQLRTGVAPQLTLDPDVLAKSTMGAFVGALEQASQRLELLVRLFAETGWRRLCQKVHYLLRTYFDEPQQVEIGGQWTTVDPSTWKKRSNMNVGVGLGFANQQQIIGMLAQMLQAQKDAMQLGLVDPPRIYNTFDQIISRANIGPTTQFFIDPTTPEYKGPPPAPPAPEMIVAQAQAQSLAADSKRKDFEVQQKTELDQAKLAQDKAAKDSEDEWKAVDSMNKIEELTQKKADLISNLALRDAQIQELNSRAVKEAPGSAAGDDTSSKDEMQRANIELRVSQNKSKGKNGGGDAASVN